MAKKRPTLDAFLGAQTSEDVKEEAPKAVTRKTPSQPKPRSIQKELEAAPIEKPVQSDSKADKHDVIRHMLYLPLPVYDQLQGLIFEEQRGQKKRRRTHDYLLDAIDLLFKQKGLKSISEITGKNE